MSQTKRTIRFYSKEEAKVLAPFIKKNVAIDKQAITDFCKKYNRSMGSVLVYIYQNRKKLAKRRKMVKSIAPVGKLMNKKDNSIINLNKGEFNIPIKSWNISQNNGEFYFTVKF